MKAKILAILSIFAVSGVFTTSALVANAQNGVNAPAGWGNGPTIAGHIGPNGPSVVPPPASHSPVITRLTAPTHLDVDEEGTWTLTAFDPLDGSLTYSVDWGDTPSGIRPLSPDSPFEQTSTFSHAYAAPGVYTVTITVENEEGLSTHTSTTVLVGEASDGDDQHTPPVISHLKVVAIKKDRATVEWNTTPKTTAEVWISKSTPNTHDEPTEVRTRLAPHQNVRLDHLTKNTTYYVVVRSTDANGNSVTSGVISFKTKK